MALTKAESIAKMLAKQQARKRKAQQDTEQSDAWKAACAIDWNKYEPKLPAKKRKLQRDTKENPDVSDDETEQVAQTRKQQQDHGEKNEDSDDDKWAIDWENGVNDDISKQAMVMDDDAEIEMDFWKPKGNNTTPDLASPSTSSSQAPDVRDQRVVIINGKVVMSAAASRAQFFS